MSLIKIKQLLSQKHKLEKQIAQEIKKTYPEGSRVTIERGRGMIHAEVREHSSWNRVKILNLNTDKEYWIETYWLYRFP